ncbi:MAG: transglutaminase family protein [Methylophilaceae bacterium]
MRYRITHTTEYNYPEMVGLSYNEARLLPRHCTHQRLISATLKLNPLAADYRVREDFFGNQIAYFSIQQAHQKFAVTATSEVELLDKPVLPGFAQALSWETVGAMLIGQYTPEFLEARQFILDSPYITATPQLAAYAQPSFLPGRPLIAAVNDLMQRIHEDFTFDPHFTDVATPLATVLQHKRGVCQDFAHLAIACIRSQGLAARYISGYIETLPPPGKVKLVGTDASHAWFAIYLPAYGWIDFDPTNNQLPGNQHITVAWGRDYGDVTPLKGVVFGGQQHQLKVAVEVECLENCSH